MGTEQRFVVSGSYPDGEIFEFQKESLAAAGYLSSKLQDNGVMEIRIAGPDGAWVSVEEAWEAHRTNCTQEPFGAWLERNK